MNENAVLDSLLEKPFVLRGKEFHLEYLCCDCGRKAKIVITMPKAAHDHVCSECNTVISKGSQYTYYKCDWPLADAVFKVCDSCEELRWSTNFHGRRPPLGKLLEFINAL